MMHQLKPEGMPVLVTDLLNEAVKSYNYQNQSEKAEALARIAELVLPNLFIEQNRIAPLLDLIIRAIDFDRNTFVSISASQRAATICQIVTMLNSYR